MSAGEQGDGLTRLDASPTARHHEAMIDEQLDIRGVRTHLLRGGEGPPLLYLHGAAPSAVWLPVHERLAERFSVYAPDHPGFGLSERPEWLEGIDDLVLHYVDFLAALRLERPVVVGHSLGGWIGAELAVFYPERIDRLVLANAGGLDVEGALIPDLLALTGRRLAETLFHRPEDSARLFPPPTTEDERVGRFRDMTTLALLAWNPPFDPKLLHRLGRVTTPTLVLWGEHERLIPRAHGEAYRDGIANARLEILSDCGHMAPLEQPEAFAEAVARFSEEDGAVR
jgi:pimeloyl-ACP methyl ester carboxylesterase